MDSEGVTKLNETECLQLANEPKENVLLEAIDLKSNQESVENSQITNASEDKKKIDIECEISLENGKTSVVNVVNNDDAIEIENGEKSSNAVTTTTVVTEVENDETDSHTVTKTTTITATETKNEEAPCFESKSTTKVIDSEIETPTNANVAQTDNLIDHDVKHVNLKLQDSKPIKEKNASSSVSITDATEQSASNSEESESSESTFANEDQETEAKTKIKTEKIDGVEGELIIANQPETALQPQNCEEDLNVKTNDANEINNQIKNIISDIDINIKAQEKITQLKEQELELIQKQKELANQIYQQQLLAQNLIAQNKLKEQEFQAKQNLLKQLQNQNENEKEAAKVSQEYTKWNNRQEDYTNIKESSNALRTVDLRKIFTPATDAPQILPQNRKLYASSAFYSSTLHPTVEDQVELARRISHSLSDISNQKSKGQSMYVNRKKRSVKWVHEASGQEDEIFETQLLNKENAEVNLKTDVAKPEKMPLKLVMNPRGQIRDYNSLKESINVESGLLSPDNCAELITALQLHKGRGAELFAKRRRKAENWVVDETNAGIYSPSGIPDYQQYQPRPVSSPNIVPAYSDTGKHRVQLNIHQDQLIEKYSKPEVQVVKSPWEAALQTGSASTAFVDGTKYHQSQTPNACLASSPVLFNQDVTDFNRSLAEYPLQYPSKSNQDSYKTSYDTATQPCNPQRELAYKPSVAQGWGGRNVELPRETYLQTNHQEHNMNIYNANGLNKCFCEINEQIQLQPKVNNTQKQNPMICSNSNEEIQHRLQKLENFQHCLMRQQKIASKSECNANFVSILGSPQHLPVDHSKKKNISNTSIKYYQPIKPELGFSTISDYQEENEDTTVRQAANVLDSVNVRELIFSFEQQSLKDQDPIQINRCQLATDKKMLPKAENEKNKIDTSITKGLYVPKEISLSSYAPPPKQSSDYQGITKVDFSKVYHTPMTSDGCPEFSISNAKTSGLYTSGPPKQQLNAPASYKKMSHSSVQPLPQVNFNPSPLSFEKLSKFEDTGSSVPHQRYLNAKKPLANSNVRNVSPTPFGSGKIEVRPVFDNNESHQLSFSSTSPTKQQYFGGYEQSAQQMRCPHGQSFNNSARGWRTTSNHTLQSVCPKIPVSTEYLPYSDF